MSKTKYKTMMLRNKAQDNRGGNEGKTSKNESGDSSSTKRGSRRGNVQ